MVDGDAGRSLADRLCREGTSGKPFVIMPPSLNPSCL
jgi:hypothetical protein